MAQVFKRKWKTKDGKERTSKVYYCRFQVGGTDYLRSTGQEKWADAKAEMQRIIRVVQEGASIDRIMPQFRDALKDLPAGQCDDARKEIAKGLFTELEKTLDAMPEEEHEQLRRQFCRQLMHGIGAKLPVAETWEAWKKHPNTGNPVAKTLAGYKGQWDRFEKWAKKQGIEYLHDVTPAHGENYAGDLWGDGVSPRTFNAHVKQLQSMFKVLKLAASIEINPFDHVRKRKAATESRRSLTAEELTTIFENAQGNLRYLVALGIFTGMRLGDCVCLQWDEVDFDTGMITHVPSKTKRKGKAVRVPIHGMLAPLLTKLRKKSRGQYLFPKFRKIYEHDGSAISKMFTTFLRDKCDITTNEAADSSGEQRKNAIARVGFHALRHSFVSLCAAEGVPQVALQELVGHGSPAMTAVYSHAGDEQKQKAIAALPSFGIENGVGGKDKKGK